MRAALAGVVVLSLACATPPKIPTPDRSDAQVAAQVTQAFLSAVATRDFGGVLVTLAEPLRARYSKETLARDFALEPLAKLRVENVRAALAKGERFTSTAEGVALPLGEGKRLLLVRQKDGLRIAALE